MRTRLAWLGMTFGSLMAFAGCTDLVSTVSRHSQDWRFVQSVGGIAVGAPTRDGRGHVLLPIRFDVSTTNSGIVCLPPATRVLGHTIDLTIRTSLPTEPYDSRCPPADLGRIAAGEYSVIYRDPGGEEHPVGHIRIP